MGVASLSATAAASASIHLFQSQQQSSPPPPPLLRGVFPATRGSEGGGGAFSISTRIQICFPQRRGLLFVRVKSVESSSTVDELQNVTDVPSNVFSMAYFESLGLDKSKWAKVIHRCPNLLIFSRRKVEATIDYLYEVGLSRDRIGKVLTLCPYIVGFNVDNNLRLKADYFGSMGVNLTSLISNHPTIFTRSIECQLKPVTEFLLDKGFSIDEIGSMASRYGVIYGLSLTKNLIPKWDFFLTLDYPRSELVKYPIYFGFSLERRIKPRYSQMRDWGVKLSLTSLLGTSDSEFEKLLNRMKMKKCSTPA